MPSDIRNESGDLVAAAGFRLALCLKGKLKEDTRAAKALLAWVRESYEEAFGTFSSTFLAPRKRGLAVKGKHFDILEEDLKKAPVVAFGFRFEGPTPKAKDAFGLPYFGVWQTARSYTIDIALPEAPDDPGAFVDRLISILREAPLLAGFSGYGFCPDPGINNLLYRAIEPATRRFKAAASINIENFYMAMTDESMRSARQSGCLSETDKPGYLDLGWLTLLGPHLAERLPYPSAIRQALPNDATVTELPSGLMVRLGSKPIWGDVEKGEDLSAYHALGEVLEPVRYPDYFIGSLPFQGYEGGSRRYYWRFFPIGRELQTS